VQNSIDTNDNLVCSRKRNKTIFEFQKNIKWNKATISLIFTVAVFRKENIFKHRQKSTKCEKFFSEFICRQWQAKNRVESVKPLKLPPTYPSHFQCVKIREITPPPP
jgi:hypothetical protein